jgi:hypothetical protein
LGKRRRRELGSAGADHVVAEAVDLSDHVVRDGVRDRRDHDVRTGVPDEGMTTAVAPPASTSARVIAAPTARFFIRLLWVLVIVSAFPLRQVSPASCGN